MQDLHNEGFEIRPCESTMYSLIDPFSMINFFNFVIGDEYTIISALRNSLGEVSSLIDRDAFRPLLSDMYEIYEYIYLRIRQNLKTTPFIHSYEAAILKEKDDTPKQDLLRILTTKKPILPKSTSLMRCKRSTRCRRSCL